MWLMFTSVRPMYNDIDLDVKYYLNTWHCVYELFCLEMADISVRTVLVLSTIHGLGSWSYVNVMGMNDYNKVKTSYIKYLKKTYQTGTFSTFVKEKSKSLQLLSY